MFWDFVQQNMTLETVKDFLQILYMDTSINVSAPRSAANLLLVHGDSEYAFSSDDLSWLDLFGDAYICTTDFGYDVFCVEANCLLGDYYTACAALIKLFSKAFSQRILFLFHFDSAIAFGCKRDYYGQAPGNFCVTQRFDIACENVAQDFLSELSMADTDDLPWLIIRYSPQESSELFSKHDKFKLNVDYLRFLNEFSAMYGVDTTSEYERYIHEFEEPLLKGVAYQEAKEALAGIADEEVISSYETLDQASEAEERYRLIQEKLANTSSTNPQIDDDINEFSKEAFLKADIMLDEMLNRR